MSSVKGSAPSYLKVDESDPKYLAMMAKAEAEIDAAIAARDLNLKMLKKSAKSIDAAIEAAEDVRKTISKLIKKVKKAAADDSDASSVSSVETSKKSKKDKPKREAGAWPLYTKHIIAARAEEYSTFCDNFTKVNGSKKGVAPVFASLMSYLYQEEFKAFYLEKAGKEAPARKTPSDEVIAMLDADAVEKFVAKAKKARDAEETKERKAKSKTAKALVEQAKTKKPATPSVRATAGAGRADSDSESESEAESVKAPKASAAAAAASDSDSEEEVEETLKPKTIKGIRYLLTPSGLAWKINADGSRGDWAGKYDAKTGKIDDSVEEPEVE